MMTNPYFSSLLFESGFPNKNLDQITRDSLNPFVSYIERSIKALEKKQVSCFWERVYTKRYQIGLPQKIFQITPLSEIRVESEYGGWFEILCEEDGTPIDDDFAPDSADPIVLGKGLGRKKYSIEKKHIVYQESNVHLYLPEIRQESAVISWSGYRLKIQSLTKKLDKRISLKIDENLCPIVRIEDNRIVFEGEVNQKSKILVDNKPIAYEILVSPKIDASWIQYNSSWVVFHTMPSLPLTYRIKNITNDLYKELQSSDFQGDHYQYRKWNVEEKNNKVHIYIKGKDTNQKLPKELIWTRFKIKVNVVSDPNQERWIQLLEDDASEETRSILDYFFEDDVNIHNDSVNNKHSYKVLKSNFEERQLLLSHKNAPKKSVYPPKNEKKLKVKINTYQLKKQKEAMFQLMNRPMLEQLSLLRLFVPKEKNIWPKFQPREDTIQWQVLTDDTYNGCDKQKEFVQKALECPDFTILDGPPGTGKTTTILEIIAQFVKEGKRVLMTASTHAAINNVLERVADNETLKREVFPLRIGDEDKARGVKQYQYDNLLESMKQTHGDYITEQIMVDSSNLICGTTHGILRLFRKKEVQLNYGAPPFDVMIIDECSKTLFQEFLVPACYAKRWILVGDIRQLSPFTDRQQIIANLQAVDCSGPGYTSQEMMRACYLLEKLRGNKNSTYSVPFIIPATAGVLNAVRKECQVRVDDDYKKVLVLTKNQEGNIYKKPELLYEHTICFIEESLFPNLHSYFPLDAVILHEQWHRTLGRFQIEDPAKKNLSFYFDKQPQWTIVNLCRSLLKEFTMKGWADEICWRIERLYWLRLSSNNKRKTSNYRKTLRRLYSQTKNIEEKILEVQNLSFPSILEALSGGGVQTRNKGSSTIKSGFDKDIRDMRYTTLTYQHRMHPDISKFPREQFYNSASLLDGNRLDRDWTYDRYDSHYHWHNILGKVKKGNKNPLEAKELIKELKAFAEWSKNKSEKKWEVAVLTFYKGQEKQLRDELRLLSKDSNKYARFFYENLSIKLATVDYFQGQEADVVFLSMVNTERDGFLDSPNRLNVAITRARYQLVIVGAKKYFLKSRSAELSKLAHTSQKNKKGI